MNSKQRNKNRQTAKTLRLQSHTCENCGERGGHWIEVEPQSLDDMLTGRPSRGFWTCAKYYGPDGRRLPEHTDRKWSEPADALGIAALIFSGALAHAG